MDTGEEEKKRDRHDHVCIDAYCVCISLKPLDIEIMKRLGSRVNLIPVIAKADTLIPQDLILFKNNVSGKNYILLLF